MEEKILTLVTIFIQTLGTMAVVLLAYSFLSGLWNTRSFKKALGCVKDLLKEIPYPYILTGLVLFSCIYCAFTMVVSFLLDAING